MAKPVLIKVHPGHTVLQRSSVTETAQRVCIAFEDACSLSL